MNVFCPACGQPFNILDKLNIKAVSNLSTSGMMLVEISNFYINHSCPEDK